MVNRIGGNQGCSQSVRSSRPHDPNHRRIGYERLRQRKDVTPGQKFRFEFTCPVSSTTGERKRAVSGGFATNGDIRVHTSAPHGDHKWEVEGKDSRNSGQERGIEAYAICVD